MGKDWPCRAGRASAGAGVLPGHLPTPSVSPGGSAVTRWLELRAKPRSGMVCRETRTCRPLSAGKQSNCTCHCEERRVSGGTPGPGVPRLHRAPQTHRRAARRPASRPNPQPASPVGAQLQEGELQFPDIAELCEKPAWGADMGWGHEVRVPAAGMPGPAAPALPEVGSARRTRRQGWQGCAGRHSRARLSDSAGGSSGGPGREGRRQWGRLSVLSAAGGEQTGGAVRWGPAGSRSPGDWGCLEGGEPRVVPGRCTRKGGAPGIQSPGTPGASVIRSPRKREPLGIGSSRKQGAPAIRSLWRKRGSPGARKLRGSGVLGRRGARCPGNREHTPPAPSSRSQ